MDKIRQTLKTIPYVKAFVVLVILNTVLDIDYLAYPFLDQFGLPLPSTVLHFVLFPLWVLWVFVFKDKDKKKSLLIFGIYTAALAIYFIIHHLSVSQLQLELPARFKYEWTTELRYIITLLLPLFVVYGLWKSKIERSEIISALLISSWIISLCLVVSNLFVFGFSTYQGMVQSNFLSWFSDAYQNYHPRELTSKFYFSEGNTLGIYLFSVYPIVLFAFIKTNNLKLYALVVLQALGMLVLGTRVSTYGALLIPGVFFAYTLVLRLLAKEKLQLVQMVFLAVLVAVLVLILPVTPSVKNQNYDRDIHRMLELSEDFRIEKKKELEEIEIDESDPDFKNFYLKIFEDNIFLFTVPNIYYREYYPVKDYPKFYVDYMFNYPIYERANGRQFQAYFTNYHWNGLSSSEKMLGLGYGRFMEGSVVLEKDFVMQVYMLGFAGVILIFGPWFALALFALYKLIKKPGFWKDSAFVSIGISIGALLGGAYLSGHVLDQFMTNILLAISVYLLFNAFDQKEKA